MFMPRMPCAMGFTGNNNSNNSAAMRMSRYKRNVVYTVYSIIHVVHVFSLCEWFVLFEFASHMHTHTDRGVRRRSHTL